MPAYASRCSPRTTIMKSRCSRVLPFSGVRYRRRAGHGAACSRTGRARNAARATMPNSRKPGGMRGSPIAPSSTASCCFTCSNAASGRPRSSWRWCSAPNGRTQSRRSGSPRVSDAVEHAQPLRERLRVRCRHRGSRRCGASCHGHSSPRSRRSGSRFQGQFERRPAATGLPRRWAGRKRHVLARRLTSATSGRAASRPARTGRPFTIGRPVRPRTP